MASSSSGCRFATVLISSYRAKHVSTVLIALTLCATIPFVYSDVGPGQNAYLPPDKGYKYPPPKQPFPTPSRPTRPSTYSPPPSYPTPGYTPPPASRPTIPTTYVPPRTSPKPYVPPSITSTPYRPPTQPPTYRPTQPTYRPTQPTYRPTEPIYRPTQPTYRPTQPTYRPTQPTYRPSPPPSYGPPPSGPTPTRPPYRPSKPTGPPYDKDGGASEHDHVQGQGHEHHHHEPGMPFDFSYAVNDAEHGNDYSHNAISDGDVTRGEYRIQLPDGRTQIVKYTADWKNGFNAQVSFEGQPTYPQFQGSGSSPQGGGYKY